MDTLSYIDIILDKAFRRAKLNSQNIKDKNPILKAKKRELVRIETVKNIIISELDKLYLRTPKERQLPKFYSELLKTFIDYRIYKRSLFRLIYMKKIINELYYKYKNSIKITRDPKKMSKLRREFYGRVSSVLKRNKDVLFILIETQRIFKKFPDLKPLPTIVISGLPNVGKSTLLYKLTGSKPEIQPYPFTTKGIVVGYIRTPYTDIQVIDTPGILDRPIDSMNPIEKRAILSIDFLADYIVYVIDITEHCGCSLNEQLSLLNQIESKFSKPLVLYFSKFDIFNEQHKNMLDNLSRNLNKVWFVDSTSLKSWIISEIKSKKLF